MGKQGTREASFKMLYQYKVGIFAGVLAVFTLFIAYVTVPGNIRKPNIRVLYISFSDHSSVLRSRYDSSFGKIDDSVQILKFEEDSSVTIDREEWDLNEGSETGGIGFFKNNIVLECSASFTVAWKYKGYGNPFVTEENVRVHRDVRDTSTFTYISLLNLMPISEKSTGNYSCSGESNDTSRFFASVHLFVPGESTFLIDFDTTIESPGEDQIIVPCPVTNSSANISLYFKNQEVSFIDNLFTFDHKIGFYLTPKFVEEQAEPWGQFYCKNEKTGEKSGIITIQPAKGLIVNAVPETSTVLLSKDSSTDNPEEKFKFLCQAKEEVTLKFLKVVKNPMVQYEFNSSSSFPFLAYTEVNTKHFRNLSRIYCRTVRNNEDLHSWKVLFSSLALRSETMDFQYDATREDFACCSPSNKKARLTLLPCHTLSECRIQGHCLIPGHQCNPELVTVLPERAGCVRYKLMQGSDNQNGRDLKGRRYSGGNGGRGQDQNGVEREENMTLESGLLQCSIEGEDEEQVFFALRSRGENESAVTTVITRRSSGGVGGVGDGLEIMEVKEKKTGDGGRRRFVCRGARFFLALGFLWQTVDSNGETEDYFGRDRLDGPWIKSQFDLIQSGPKKNAKGSYTGKIQRIYCIAPLWSLAGKDIWMNVKFDLIQ